MTRSRQSEDYTARDDYYTPQWVFDQLDMTFMVDVCAPSGGVPWIPAINYFDLGRDGLQQTWNGHVWMNPPYSKPRPWIERFADHADGIALIAISRSNAFYKLWNDKRAMFSIPEKSMVFVTPDGKKKGIFMPVCFVAMGDRCQDKLAYANLGRVR